jgi:glutamate transport system permease protein
VIVKDTSLGFVVFGFSEFVRTANTVIQFFGGQLGVNLPLQMYVAVALVFILINYGLGKLAELVQRRLARGRRSAAEPTAVVPTAAEVGAP